MTDTHTTHNRRQDYVTLLAAGETGAGKTTLLNLLFGLNMGTSRTTSMTHATTLVRYTERHLNVVETPGFGDTGGEYQDIANIECVKEYKKANFQRTVFPNVILACVSAHSTSISGDSSIFAKTLRGLLASELFDPLNSNVVVCITNAERFLNGSDGDRQIFENSIQEVIHRQLHIENCPCVYTERILTQRSDLLTQIGNFFEETDPYAHMVLTGCANMGDGEYKEEQVWQAATLNRNSHLTDNQLVIRETLLKDIYASEAFKDMQGTLRREAQKRQEAEEARQKAEDEAREQEAQKKRAEEARQKAEDEAREQEAKKKRAEEYARQQEAEKKRAEEDARQQEAEKKRAEEACKKAQDHARQQEAEKKRAEEACKKAQDDRREEETRRREEETRRREAETRRREEETRRREAETRRREAEDAQNQIRIEAAKERLEQERRQKEDTEKKLNESENRRIHEVDLAERRRIDEVDREKQRTERAEERAERAEQARAQAMAQDSSSDEDTFVSHVAHAIGALFQGRFFSGK